MPEWLRDSMVQEGDVAPEVVLWRLAMGLLFGAAVAGVYHLTHRRDTPYERTFVPTLVLLTILIALVTLVIGGSVARAFSLVGALSIVRFRTVVADTRDTAFVIFAVVIGMALGGGHAQLALAGLAVGSLAAMIFRPRATDVLGLAPEWDLTVRLGLGLSPDLLEPVWRKYVQASEIVGTETCRQGAAIELTYRVRLTPAATPAALVAELNQLEGVQNVQVERR